jgi:hypothetical protein
LGLKHDEGDARSGEMKSHSVVTVLTIIEGFPAFIWYKSLDAYILSFM